MFDKLMGSLSRRAERRSEEQAARSAGGRGYVSSQVVVAR